MDSGVPATEVEELSPNDMINDYFLTSLRTIWGADLNYILENFGGNVAQRTLDTATKYAKKCIMNVKSDCISIKPEHFLVSDGIIVDFLV
jgi:oxygen-independent coproporphyrinogen-3 oxidase